MNSLESFVKFIPSANNVSIAVAPAQILTDLESKARKFTNSLNESFYESSNEPSLGLYRVQEHVRKTIPNFIDKKNELDSYNSKLKGNSFDLDYSIDAVKKINKAEMSLESIKSMLTDSLFAARQINIKKLKINTSNQRSDVSKLSSSYYDLNKP